MADNGRTQLAPPIRPEFEAGRRHEAEIGDAARPLTAWERLVNNTAARRVFILVVLATAWELYARWLANPLMFPSFSDMTIALWDATTHGPLLERTFTSIQVLLLGYASGIALAAVCTTLA